MESPARVVAHSTNAAPALPISCTCGHRRDTEPAHPGAPGTNHPPQYGHPVTPGATRSPVESNPRGVYFWLRGIPKPYVKNRSTVWESRTRNVLCSRTFQIISSSPLSRNSLPHSRQRSILTPHSSCLLNYLTAAFPFSFRLAQYFFILSDWASRCAAERFLRRPRPDSPCRGDGLGPSREELLRPSSLRIPSISASSASLFAIRFSSASSRSLCLSIGRVYTTGGLVLTNLLELERVPIFRS